VRRTVAVLVVGVFIGMALWRFGALGDSLDPGPNTTSIASTAPTDWSLAPIDSRPVLNGEVRVAPGADFGVLFAGSTPATTYVFEPGVHTGVEVQPRSGDVYLGLPGAVLDGGSQAKFAFHAHDVGNPITGVVIQGLTIENYATPLQQGAVGGGGAHDWIVEGNEIRFNQAAGVGIGAGMVVRGNYIHHNGQLGIHSGYPAAKVLLVGNEIAFNNHLDIHDMSWEAGGVKLIATDRAEIIGNFVHQNHGPGLWTDGSNTETVYEDNVVLDNYGPGIFHEISYDAVIRGNRVEGNGHRFYVGGILVANSSNVEVHGNLLRANNGGVVGIQDERGSGSRGPFDLKNLRVHDNHISHTVGFTGVRRNGGSRDVFTSWGNQFDYNTYDVGSLSRPFMWGGSRRSARQWMALGHDRNATWR
jgi:parallel beta-helix repeat protein